MKCSWAYWNIKERKEWLKNGFLSPIWQYQWRLSGHNHPFPGTISRFHQHPSHHFQIEEWICQRFKNGSQNYLNQTFSPRSRIFLFLMLVFFCSSRAQVLKKLATPDQRSRKLEWSMEQFVREMTTNNLSQSAAKKVTRPTNIDNRQQFSSLQMTITSYLLTQFVVEYGFVIALDLWQLICTLIGI